MKYLWLYIVGVVVGFVVTYIFYAYTNSSEPRSPAIKQPTAREEISTYSIVEPPTKSLKGEIASKSGSLLFESRLATIAGELKDTNIIQQGERLITETGGNATLKFDKVGSLELSEETEVSFIQTLPTNFVVEQKRGVVKYTVEGTIPISIRIRSAIITRSEGGLLQIEMTDGDPIILISTISGQAKIGFNDLDYVSQVFTLRSGEVYEYNSDGRTAINIENK